MTTQPTATPAGAVATLSGLASLGDLGFSLTAISSDSEGEPVGYEIKLTADAQAEVSGFAQETRDKLQDAALIDYGPATLIPRQHWMHVAKTDAATLAAIEQVVGTQDLLPFNNHDEVTVTMLAARFTASDGTFVTFYRVADSLLQFKKSKLLGLLQEGDVFGRLEPANVLLLRADFDVVVVDGHAFFAKKTTFEKAFGFLEELKAASLETFNAVTINLRIQGLDELRDASTSQIQMMSKMASVKRSMDEDPDYAEAMTTDNLIKYIEDHPHVDIDIVGEGDDRELVFDPRPARRFQILKLLDDDFLHSVLTERDYEAGSKQRTNV